MPSSRFEAAENKKDFPGWVNVAVALVISGQSMMVSLGLNTAEEPPTFGSFIYWAMHGVLIASALVTVILLGRPLFRNLIKAARKKKITIEALFAVSLVGALIVSLQSTFAGHGGIYYDVVSLVLLIYTFGNSLKARAFDEARRILSAARAQMAFAWVENSGKLVRVSVDSLKPGQCVVIKPGEMSSVDGVIEEGQAFISMASVTGEPAAVAMGPGDKIPAGAFSTDGLLVVRVVSISRAIDAIFGVVGGEAPSGYEQLADRVTRWFLPVVGGVATVTFIVWTIFSGAAAGVTNAMSVLLVACPCALGIATPLGVQAFLHRLVAYGWRGRSGELVERLAAVDTVFFDKTGTLTLADLKIAGAKWQSEGKFSEKELRGLVALAEKNVPQPIARAFEEWNSDVEGLEAAALKNMRVYPGEGISAMISYRGESIEVIAGQKNFLNRLKVRGTWPTQLEGKRFVWIAVDGKASGVVSLNEQPMPATQEMIAALLDAGMSIEILTGDPDPQIAFDPRVKVNAGLSPEQKLQLVEAAQKKGAKILFVGDGINDALAMKAAFCSLAVAEGSPLSHAAATAVVGGSGVCFLPQALAVAKKARAALSWNLRFSAGYNFVGIALAALGILNPVVASLLMLTSSVIVAGRALGAVNAGVPRSI